MDSLKRLGPFIAVAAQLQPADMGTLAAAGYHSVINNRPDNEDEGQPSSAEMRAAAEASGLEYHHLPVVSGQINSWMGADLLDAPFRQVHRHHRTSPSTFGRSAFRSRRETRLA